VGKIEKNKQKFGYLHFTPLTPNENVLRENSFCIRRYGDMAGMEKFHGVGGCKNFKMLRYILAFYFLCKSDKA
jgi:hypothetical protein